MRRRIWWIAAIVYAAVAVAQLCAIAVGGEWFRTGTQMLIMPALLVLAHAPIVDRGREIPMPRRDRIGLTIAILACWAGDVIPRSVDGEASFAWMLVLFLVGQLAWSWELAAGIERSVLAHARVLLLPYLAIGAIVMSACLPGTGLFAGIVPVYAIAVLLTGVLATAYGVAGIIGGLLSIASNALIGLFMFVLAFDPGDPMKSLLIMSAYMGAQVLLVIGVRRSIIVHAHEAEQAAAAGAVAREASSGETADAEGRRASGLRTPLPGPDSLHARHARAASPAAPAHPPQAAER